MAFESDFLGMMPVTVTVEPFVTQDGYSKAAYGDPVSYQVFLDETSRMHRTSTSQVLYAQGTVYLPPTAVVGTKDRLTLPDGQQPKVVGVDRQFDDQGLHHLELYFQITPRRT
jgi:hypothetical protein